jgi:hypothetical protein
MQADIRFSLLFLLTSVFLAGPGLAVAQPQSAGSLPSSSSFVRGAAPATNTNLSTFGPNGYSNVLQPFMGTCCDEFLPLHPRTQPRPPLAPSPSHPQHSNSSILPITVYVPYAVGYLPDAEDDTPDDASASSDPDQDQPPVRRHKAAKQETTENIGANASDDSASVERNDVRNDGTAEPEGDVDAPAAPDPPAEPVVVQPATVLVFKDGHRVDVVNYAIVGDALFDFADGRARKILLADLDLAATQKANDAAGVEFKLPMGNAALSGQN